MIRPVLKKGNPLLEQRSREVTDINQARRLINDLSETLTAIQGLYRFTRGSGISAPQIGVLRRACIVEYANQRHTLINPAITDHSDEQILIKEGCLSFFDYRGVALRFAEVTVRAVDVSGEEITINAQGGFAALTQHEIDHLDGILFDSRLAPNEQLTRVEGVPQIP